VRRAAIVLCGGGSARMGADKAGLRFGRGTLLSRAVLLARSCCDEVIVVAPRGRRLPPLPRGVRVARDRDAGRGPLEGLAAGLAASRAPVAVAIPCDAPFLAPALLEALLAAVEGGAAAAAPVVKGRLEPLPSAYRTRLAPAAAALCDAGARRLDSLAASVRARRIPEATVRRLDPALDSFRDCDTPAAYAAARRRAIATRVRAPTGA
jgi:molybdopterin-guanine dinucleotide biosynthesis protein A